NNSHLHIVWRSNNGKSSIHTYPYIVQSHSQILLFSIQSFIFFRNQKCNNKRIICNTFIGKLTCFLKFPWLRHFFFPVSLIQTIHCYTLWSQISIIIRLIHNKSTGGSLYFCKTNCCTLCF